MTSDRLLDRDAIRSLLLEVADELSGAEGTRTLVMVGGSLLAWRGLRQSTEDVDSVRLLDAPLRAAVARVAERHDLAPDWLNSHATAFAPNTLDLDECDVLIEGGALRVLGAPLHLVFLMKLRRSSAADLQDLRAMWPSVQERFPSARVVVDAFKEAFPAEPDDEYLDQFVVAELAKGGFDLPN